MLRLRLPLVLLLGCTVFCDWIQLSEQCAGLKIPFEMWPTGDHVVELNNSLDVYCVLNMSHPDSAGRSSRDLSFIHFDMLKNKSNYSTSIVNDTAIKIHLEKPSLGTFHVYCHLETTNYTCFQQVRVGYKPLNVTNFTFRSLNWEEPEVRWKPLPNPVKTTYRVFMWYFGSASSKHFQVPCTNKTDVKENYCRFPLTYYRQTRERMFFNLNGQNVLGERNFTFGFDHFSHVIPNPPTEIRVFNVTDSSAVLSWRIPITLSNFAPGLKYKIAYLSDKDPDKTWREIRPDNVTAPIVISGKDAQNFTLTDLPYAHSTYSAKIFLRTGAGPDRATFSVPGNTSFTTASRRPDAPPKTTTGCFEVVSQGNMTDVFVYWTKIPATQENGDGFSYKIDCVMNNEFECESPLETTQSYVKYPINGDAFYNFTISSRNHMGLSKESSTVYVPDIRSIPQPKGFTVKAGANGVYELSWKPIIDSRPHNYTIFWCEDDIDRGIPCKGVMKWKNVGREKTANVTKGDLKKFYRFAISVNFADGTSGGLVWTYCSIGNDKAFITRFDDFRLTEARHDGFDVLLFAESRCTPDSDHYSLAIDYCPLADGVCDESHQKRLEVTFDTKSARLNNLIPATNYEVRVSVIFLSNGQRVNGTRSSPQTIWTDVGTPSAPLGLHAKNITNTSVELDWTAPVKTNGDLRFYQLEEETAKQPTLTLPANKTSVLLKELHSNTLYNFSIKACTESQSRNFTRCSAPSEVLLVKTECGVPGRMDRPQILVFGMRANVSWGPPHGDRGGCISYYQLCVVSASRQECHNEPGSNKTVEVSECQSEKTTPKFKIRAISNSRNITLKGEWSDEDYRVCSSSGSALMITTLWIVGSALFVLLCVGLYWLIKRGWLKCRKMKDVEVKLPPGLQSQDLEKSNQDFLHLERWPPRSGDGNNGSLNAGINPDEESLLDKKSDESLDTTPFNMPRKNGGDSSGCSVGRGSVSSSTISDPPVSSDSGAEADPCIAGPKEPCLKPRDSSAKRRPPIGKERKNPNSIVDDPVHFDDDSTEFAHIEATKPGYTRVGFTNSPEKSLPAKGYVTFASVTSANAKSNDLTYNMLPTDSYSRFYEEKPTVGLNSSASGKAFSTISPQTNLTPTTSSASTSTPPRYITLALLQEQRNPQASLDNARCAPTEMRNLEDVEEQDEVSGDCRDEGDSSGAETETDTVHAMPITIPMPPYVTMFENPIGRQDVDDDEEEEEEEEEEGEKEEDDEENLGIQGEEENDELRPSESPCRKTVNEIGLVEKRNLESNYIPHSMFSKESVQT